MIDPDKSMRRMLRGVAVVAVLAAAAAVCCAVTSAARASSRPLVVAGKGVWLAGHTDFVGYYRAEVGGRRVKVYCVSPDLRAPSRIDLHTVARVRSTSRTVTRELAETLAAHGNARSAAHAEAVSQALNTEMGNRRAVTRRARHLSRHVRALTRRYVAEARARRGPYRVSLQLPTSPLPGQAGTGTIVLRSAVEGVAGAVTLRHTGNVSAPQTVRVNGSGRASFGYRTIGGGPVHVAATTVGMPTSVRASRPSRGAQLMLTWSPRPVVRTNATYQGSGPAFTHRYSCTSVCNGHPNVTLTACAPPSRYASRLTYWYAGRTHRISFAAAGTRVCKSWHMTVADGVSVSATWRWQTPHGWTAPIPAGGAFVVDCPPAPPVAVSFGYDCAHAAVTAVLGSQEAGGVRPLRNRTTHRMVLVIGGAASGRFELPPGSTAVPHTFPFKCGTHAELTVRPGVQRRSGAYNYGKVAEVITP